MSYSVSVLKNDSPIKLDFEHPLSVDELNLLNNFSDYLPYHLKYTSWSDNNLTSYFLDTPNNQYKGYLKNTELFQQDFISLKYNGFSVSGITEQPLFKSIQKFLTHIFPDLNIHQYFVLSLISQSFIDCPFSFTEKTINFSPTEDFVKNFGIQSIIFLQQLFSNDTCDFFNSFFKTNIKNNSLSGHITISYESENQMNVLSLIVDKNSLQLSNFNSNINAFDLQQTYDFQKVKDENFLGISSSFKKIIQFVELDDKLSLLPSKPKSKSKI